MDKKTVDTYKTKVTSDGELLSQEKKTFEIFNEDGLLFKANQYFIKSFQGNKISDILKNKIEIANMYILAENMYKDTNMIAVLKSRKVYPASIADISKIIGMCEKRTRQFIDRMIKMQLIAKDIVTLNGISETQYFINPLYFMTNKRLSPALYMKFRRVLDKELSTWAKITLNEADNLTQRK